MKDRSRTVAVLLVEPINVFLGYRLAPLNKLYQPLPRGRAHGVWPTVIQQKSANGPEQYVSQFVSFLDGSSVARLPPAGTMNGGVRRTTSGEAHPTCLPAADWVARRRVAGTAVSSTQPAQSSHARSWMRLNSRLLAVTNVSPRCRAWPAISRSYAPTGVPARSRIARAAPASVASSSSKGSTVTGPARNASSRAFVAFGNWLLADP